MTMVISCPECHRQANHEARGLCGRCYQRLKSRGELDRYPARVKSLSEWVQLIDTSDPDTCWPWPGPMTDRGYGAAARGPAHRAVYKLMVGPIPADLQIDHHCHNVDDSCAGGVGCPHRACVNWVRHLQPVTTQNNLLASAHTLNSINVAKTECPHGHPYDEANTSYRNGRRHCRQCARDRRRATYYANLEEERTKGRERARKWNAARRAS